ncbi:MAG: hypothetical protein OXG38_01400 [Chloroflexi bacterium]|nr:hypothetical protein [Chloroflexota bacterium]
MAITLGPAAATAALLGLFVTGAIAYSGDGGEPRLIAWLPFVGALALVARDSFFQGSFRNRPSGRVPGVRLRDGAIHLQLRDFEPIATTLAILTGLLAADAIGFHDANDGGSGWAWSAFALALALSIGWRLGPRPRRRDRDATADHERVAEFWAERMRDFAARQRR